MLESTNETTTKKTAYDLPEIDWKTVIQIPENLYLAYWLQNPAKIEIDPDLLNFKNRQVEAFAQKCLATGSPISLENIINLAKNYNCDPLIADWIGVFFQIAVTEDQALEFVRDQNRIKADRAAREKIESFFLQYQKNSISAKEFAERTAAAVPGAAANFVFGAEDEKIEYIQGLIAKNKPVIITGQEGTGKTSLAAFFVAKQVIAGKKVYIFDFENRQRFVEYIKLFGGDVNQVSFYSKNQRIKNIGHLEKILLGGVHDFFVFDTVLSLLIEIGGDVLDTKKSKELANLLNRVEKSVLALNHYNKSGQVGGNYALNYAFQQKLELFKNISGERILKEQKNNYKPSEKELFCKKVSFLNNNFIFEDTQIEEDDLTQYDLACLLIDQEMLTNEYGINGHLSAKDLCIKGLDGLFINNVETIKRALKIKGFKPKKLGFAGGGWVWKKTD